MDGELLGLWLFTAAEPSPAGSEFYLDQADSYVWNDEDQASFVVGVPDSFDDEVEIPQIAAIVSKFKLQGKNFIIEKIRRCICDKYFISCSDDQPENRFNLRNNQSHTDSVKPQPRL